MNNNQNNNTGNNLNGKNRKPSGPRGFFSSMFKSFTWFYLLLILGVFIMYQSYNGGQPLESDWFTFKEQMVPQGDVEKIEYISNKNQVEVTIKKDHLNKYEAEFKNGLPASGPHFYFNVSENIEFEREIGDMRNSLPEEQRFGIKTSERIDYLARALDWLIFPLILILLYFLFFRRMTKDMGNGGGGGGIFNVGKSQAKLFDKNNNTKVTFKDVAGMEEAKVEVMEIVDFLKNPGKYTALGGKIPKGALLVGPPGTGKTLLAKAVAGEANVPFFSISGSDFVEMFVGVGASRVRDLFKQAKEKSPCIVFIDEIDAVGRARSKNVGFSSNDERENTLNQLLTEMDGFGTNSGIIVLAATNRVDILDKALLRAGRFDRQIHVDLPELSEREAIFKVHSRNLKLSKDFDISIMAKQTPGFSGADIANVCNEAALIAARKDKKDIDKQDFLDAVDRIIGGLERKSKVITPTERRTIAFHEAGHATVSWILPNANPLLKVTIIPRGKALGAAWYLPEERQITTTEQMMDEMAATLGGRVAEQIINGKISTGALNDLEKVTRQAYAMVSYFGMSEKVGNLSFYDSSGRSDMSFGKPYSEKTAELLDSEARAFIDKAYEMAFTVLTEHKEQFTQLAELLLDREVIFAEDLVKIFGPREGTINEVLEESQKPSQAELPEQTGETGSAGEPQDQDVDVKIKYHTEDTAEETPEKE